VENGLLGALERVDGAADELLAAWGEDLEGDVVGHDTGGGDETTSEFKVRVRGRGERDLDLLVAQLDEHLEVSPFLLAVHGVYQALVAVAEIGRQPSRSLVDGLGGPLAVGQVKRLELGVFLPWFLEPVCLVSSEVPCAGLGHACRGCSYMGMMGGIEVGCGDRKARREEARL
jgi:hypothetical protein